jgi:diguanylate cyclase (GGDEF)-like protein
MLLVALARNRAVLWQWSGVAMDKSSKSSGVIGETLEMLTGLKQTSVGTVVYDQLARVVQDYEQQRSKLDQTYGLLLQLLLDAYARNPSPESVIALNARLIQLRQTSDDAADTSYDDDADVPTSNAEPSTEYSHDADSVDENVQAERRMNTAYRLHLDRKRDEIEKLQETLSQSIGEAINQNREFGALLKIELGALKQAEGETEIENLRQILIGGIEELINSQGLLETKLHHTGNYLGLVKADSKRLRDELHKVRVLSLTDEFTGLPNRRAFMRRLQDEIGRAQRYDTPLALALLDLDEFKSINDLYGHSGGDEVLRCYATDVLSILRHHDMVARYGGEEFAVMFPNTTEEGALAAMSKARLRAYEVQCRAGDKIIKMPTFSAGVAMYQTGESSFYFIERADRALYLAKAQGRDRVQIAATTAAAPTVAAGPRAEETL